MIEYKYCQFWNRVLKVPGKEMSREKALALHAKGHPLVAVAFREGRAFGFVEDSAPGYLVGLLDPSGRVETTYDFRRLGDGRLFLQSARVAEFKGETTEVACAERYTFEQSGHVQINSLLRNGERWQENGEVDVSANYDVEPAFGDYERLLARERPPRSA